MITVLVVLAGASALLSGFTLAIVARMERRQLQLTTPRGSVALTAEPIGAPHVAAGSGTGRPHYVVQRHDRLTTKIEYEGFDSDVAVATWAQLERDPESFPGTHEFLENGRRRGHRLAGQS